LSSSSILVRRFRPKSKNILNEIIPKVIVKDLEGRNYYNLVIIIEKRRNRVISWGVNLPTAPLLNNCKGDNWLYLHAEKVAWKRGVYSKKENYYLISVRLKKDGRLVNGGAICDKCNSFLKKSNITYGYEYIDGEYRKRYF
jgi:hypothetical protein